jgi:microcystin-dependent protein
MSEPFIAEIIMFGGNFAPRGWAFCDGQLLAISQNTALFSLLGTTYGGDGRTTFGLPDLRGRVPIHPGTGPGLSTYRLGQKGGTETVQLNVNEIPSHTHTARGTSSRATDQDPAGNVWAKEAVGATAVYASGNADTSLHTSAIANTGGSQGHTNIQPYNCVNFIIALVGLYPSRN